MIQKATTGRELTKPSKSSDNSGEVHNPHANRETVESIVVAIILAFLFRGFIAEAFVIPTGSMAPSLQGNHKDLQCEQCNHWFRAGASMENEGRNGLVSTVTCPICRYTTTIDPENLDHETFTGDRIVVSKFSYQLSDPKRWDVIVFKFPGNAKQNYIKRLIGLPNETIRIWHGDIYVKGKSEDVFRIARKPPYRQMAMLHLLDDTQHVPQNLIDIGWPTRWYPVAGGESRWNVLDGGRHFSIANSGDQIDWIRYRNIVPTAEDWRMIESGHKPVIPSPESGTLISDFYAYNAVNGLRKFENWVGDLALETDVHFKSPAGEVVLDLVEGGVHYSCRIDIANGDAVLEVNQGQGRFQEETGATPKQARGQTSIRGGGTHSIRFANVDDELRLWVDEKLIVFDVATTYVPEPNVVPKWSATDPGDYRPIGIGAKSAELDVKRLRVLRDVYYLAKQSDYQSDRDTPFEDFGNPQSWATTRLFDSRALSEFELHDDEFFPCGDNSPESKDARIWNEGTEIRIDNCVRREQLTGEALMIYYPHPWYKPLRVFVPGVWEPGVGLTPNIRRMGLIR